MALKTIIELDRKILTPRDIISAGNSISKPVRGFVVVETANGERHGENLVVLKGREFIAPKIADVESPANSTLGNYKIRYFGIGKGGATEDGNGDLTVKVGPYANDVNLYDPLQISSGNSADGITYVDNGYLKYIETDTNLGAKIEILSEDHDVQTANGTVTVSAYTTIKYTMFIRKDEMTDQKPFEFNEAGLWAVEYDSNGNVVVNDDGSVNKVLFAHFTTASKYIETSDELKIEWYILV